MSKLDDPTNPGDDLPPIPDPPEPPTPNPSAEPDGAPANELQEWRRRALEAEALVEDLRAQVESLRGELDSSGRAHALDALLREAGALHIGAARAVLEAGLPDAPGAAAPDPAVAVDELRRALPFLFRSPQTPPASPAQAGAARSAMAAAPSVGAPGFDDLDAALELASTTGDRAALLRYLRLRRAV